MTIALGILCQNAQIIAADTQMSSDVEKFSQGKISRVTYLSTPGNSGRIAITGSGDTFNLEVAQDEIGELFSAACEHPIEGSPWVYFEDRLAEFIKQFYKHHVAICPDANQRPEIELVIAARREPYSGMWAVKRSKVRRVKRFAAVGIGEAYAKSLLADLMLPQQPKTAMLMAAYVVFLVKQRNLWVGHDTEVICLNGSGSPIFPVLFERSLCRKLEDEFRHLLELDALLAHRVFGSTYVFCVAEQFEKEIELLSKRVDKIVEQHNFSQVPNEASLPPTDDASNQPPSPELPRGPGES